MTQAYLLCAPNSRNSGVTPEHEKEFNVAHPLHFPFWAFCLEQIFVIGTHATQIYRNISYVQTTVTSALMTFLFRNIKRN
jgi:hypothetical protein